MPSLICQQLKNKFLVAKDNLSKAGVARSKYLLSYKVDFSKLYDKITPNARTFLQSNLQSSQHPMTVESINLLKQNPNYTLEQAKKYFTGTFFVTRKWQIVNNVSDNCKSNQKCVASRTTLVNSVYLNFFLYHFYGAKVEIFASLVAAAKAEHNGNPCTPPV